MIKLCWWPHEIPLFVDIIKIITIFIKKKLKTLIKVKELEIMHQNTIYLGIS